MSVGGDPARRPRAGTPQRQRAYCFSTSAAAARSPCSTSARFQDIIVYCIGDVRHLPELWQKLSTQTLRQLDIILEGTKKRIASSQSPNYQPHSPEKAKAPWSKAQKSFLDQCNRGFSGIRVIGLDEYFLGADNGNGYSYGYGCDDDYGYGYSYGYDDDDGYGYSYGYDNDY